MRYLWVPFNFALWAIPTAVVALLWPEYVRQAFAALGMVRIDGPPVWIQPPVLVPALVAIAALVGGWLLARRWSVEIDQGERHTWHTRTLWLFTLAGAAGMTAVAGAVAVGVNGWPLPVWGFGATPVLIGLGVVVLLTGFFAASHLHGVAHATLVKQLTRRDPLTPGYRIFTGTVIPLSREHLVEVPVTGEAAVGWYLEIFQEHTTRHRVTDTHTQRDLSSPIGRSTTTESYNVSTKSVTREILTHQLVPLTVAPDGGGAVFVPETAGFDGVPVTAELEPTPALGEFYDLVRQRAVRNGRPKFRIVALLPGARVEAAGLIWLDEQGRPHLADHQLDNATVTAL